MRLAFGEGGSCGKYGYFWINSKLPTPLPICIGHTFSMSTQPQFQEMDEKDLLATFGTSDLYEILGVEKTCSTNIIRKAYHKKSLEVPKTKRIIEH